MSRVRHLHGQGLRAGGLQQQGLHLGQGRPAGAGFAEVIGALGDIHGAFDAARAIISAHPEIPFWLCVGDIASASGAYEPLGAPVYWVHGNNDNFDAIASGELPPDLHHIPNGTAVSVAPDGTARDVAPEGATYEGDPVARGFSPGSRPASGATSEGDRVGRGFSPGTRPALTVAGLGGTFAPTWYETPARELPHPKKGSPRATELADKRRHFVRGEVEACKSLRAIDIFLTHEAAKPFRPFPGGRGPDAGKAPINEVLAAMTPRLHLFGHHHRFSEQDPEGVRSVGLDLVTHSYLLVDAITLEYQLQPFVR